MTGSGMVRIVLTQETIARKLGVSASLVSRALSGTAAAIGAAPETVERIRVEAQRLGYRPSMAARALRGGPAGLMGVVVKSFDDPFFGRMIAELQRLGKTRGFTLLLTGQDGGSDSVSLAAIGGYRPDALIVLGSDYVPGGLQSLVRRGVPAVRVGAGAAMPEVAAVSMDAQEGFEKVADYLGALGHRAIGYLGDDSKPNRRRERLLEIVLRKRGLFAGRDGFIRVPAGPDAGERGMREWMARRGSMPTAVVVAEDVLAESALRVLHEAGRRVPGDLSVVGVDDIPSAHRMIPALTTLRQPVPEMVRRAFDLVGDRERCRSGEQVAIAPELMVRESCAAPGMKETERA